MKKLIGLVLSAALLTGTGCLLTAPPTVTPVTQPPPSVAVKTYPPVTPDQVTAQNGRQIAQALKDEMDREASTPPR